MIDKVVTTASGTVYEFCVKDNKQMVRRKGGADMRRDGDWLEVFNMAEPVVGEPMHLLLEGLGETSTTMRLTTAVTSVEA